MTRPFLEHYCSNPNDDATRTAPISPSAGLFRAKPSPLGRRRASIS